MGRRGWRLMAGGASHVAPDEAAGAKASSRPQAGGPGGVGPGTIRGAPVPQLVLLAQLKLVGHLHGHFLVRQPVARARLRGGKARRAGRAARLTASKVVAEARKGGRR